MPKYEDWEESDLDFVLPAAAYFLHLVKETLPEAEVYCLINTEIKPEIIDCMQTSCSRYGITPVNFDCIDKQCGHPTALGMRQIKDAVLKAMGK